MLGVDLNQSDVLKATNWKHVFLFIFFASAANGLGNGAEGPTNVAALGSLVYLPHAGRVLPVIFFGWKAIPAVLAAEFLEWEVLWQGADFYRTAVATSISTIAVLGTWGTFYLLGVDLNQSDVLKATNWKHVFLFIFFASAANGLGNGAWYTYCLLYTSPSPRDDVISRMPSSA